MTKPQKPTDEALWPMIEAHSAAIAKWPSKRNILMHGVNSDGISLSEAAMSAALAADPLRAKLGPAAVAAILAGEAAVVPLGCLNHELRSLYYCTDNERDGFTQAGISMVRLDKPEHDHIGEPNKMVEEEPGKIIRATGHHRLDGTIKITAVEREEPEPDHFREVAKMVKLEPSKDTNSPVSINTADESKQTEPGHD